MNARRGVAGWAFLLFLVLAVLFFWRLLAHPDGFISSPTSDQSDLIATYWPNALFIRHSLAAYGQVPLWRPSILGGEPFAANPLSGLWYPPNWLALVLPVNLALHLLVIIHAAWTGWGAYRLARELDVSPGGGLLAACTLVLAPSGVAQLAAGGVSLYFASAWLPWALLGMRRLARRGELGDVLLAAVAGALLVLADVRLGVFSGLVVGAYWLWSVMGRAAEARRSARRTPVVLLPILALSLVAALVAVQVLPLTMVTGRLSRGVMTLAESAANALLPRDLLGVLIAEHGGQSEWMTYVGAAPLLLGLVGLLRWRGAERWCWALLALVALLVSLGTQTPVYPLLYRLLLPLRWLNAPPYAWFLALVAVAMLAGGGLTALEADETAQSDSAAQRGPSARRGWGVLAVVLMGAAIAGLGVGIALRLPFNVALAAVLWPVVALLCVLRAGDHLRAPQFVIAALLIATADLWLASASLMRVRTGDEVLGEGAAAAAWLADQPPPFRVYSPSRSVPQHVAALYGLELVDGVDPFQLGDYAVFMRAATGVDLTGFNPSVPAFPATAEEDELRLAHRSVAPDLRLLGLLNVRYVAAAYPLTSDGLVLGAELGDVYVYENEYALPRAFVVEQVEPSTGLAGALAWLAQHDPAESATVDGADAVGALGMREALVVESSPNRVRVEAEGPGLLVLSEVYDPDWRIQVDDQEAQLLRVNGVLRGVFLEPNDHVVSFTYRPAGLLLGGILTAVGWVVVAVLAILGARRRASGSMLAASIGYSVGDTGPWE